MAPLIAVATVLRNAVLFTNAVLAAQLHKLPPEFDGPLADIRRRRRASASAAYTPFQGGDNATSSKSNDSKEVENVDPILTTRRPDIAPGETVTLEKIRRQPQSGSEGELADLWQYAHARATNAPSSFGEHTVPGSRCSGQNGMDVDNLPEDIRLPNKAFNELVAVPQHCSKQPQSSNKMLPPSTRPIRQPKKPRQRSITYCDSAKFNNNHLSQVLQIDSVTLPRHLTNVIQRDNFDFAHGEDPRVACWPGYEFRDWRTQPANLRAYCTKQNASQDNVEAVLYSRKRQVPEEESDDDGMDARGRMIDHVVWADRENTDPPARRRRCRCPTPIRDIVYQRGASKFSAETSLYQTPCPPPATPIPAVSFSQTLLFSSATSKTRKPPTPAVIPLQFLAVATRLRASEIASRRSERAAQQAELRKKRGGLMIDVEGRLKKWRAREIGRNTKIADQYATAFEGWDWRLKNEGGEEGKKKREWVKSMWEMPKKGRGGSELA